MTVFLGVRGFVINLIIRTFVKDYKNVDDSKVRERYGMLAGVLGIICNAVLFVLKYIVGTFSGSISVTADSFNNLSDAGSSAVTLIGFRMAGKAPDKEHPFGHGRMEYIAALIVSFLILLMGVELIKTSIEKIINPQPVIFSYVSLVILVATILVKCWMAYYNRYIGKRIKSPALSAAATDSLNDMMATGGSIFALILSQYTKIPVDGIIGAIVAVIVILAGIGILKDVSGMIIGTTPDPEFVKELEKEILSYDGVCGIHDLVIHSYGPRRTFASVHAEVSANEDIMVTHDMIDLIERDVSQKFGMSLVIHMDPIITDDERINELKRLAESAVKSIDESFTMHDFRVVDGVTHSNLIFDVVVPHNYRYSDDELQEIIKKKIQEIDKRYFAVVTIDKSFVQEM